MVAPFGNAPRFTIPSGGPRRGPLSGRFFEYWAAKSPRGGAVAGSAKHIDSAGDENAFLPYILAARPWCATRALYRFRTESSARMSSTLHGYSRVGGYWSLIPEHPGALSKCLLPRWRRSSRPKPARPSGVGRPR